MHRKQKGFGVPSEENHSDCKKKQTISTIFLKWGFISSSVKYIVCFHIPEIIEKTAWTSLSKVSQTHCFNYMWTSGAH